AFPRFAASSIRLLFPKYEMTTLMDRASKARPAAAARASRHGRGFCRKDCNATATLRSAAITRLNRSWTNVPEAVARISVVAADLASNLVSGRLATKLLTK